MLRNTNDFSLNIDQLYFLDRAIRLREWLGIIHSNPTILTSGIFFVESSIPLDHTRLP